MSELLASPVLWLSLGAVFTLLVIGALLSRMYQRASKKSRSCAPASAARR